MSETLMRTPTVKSCGKIVRRTFRITSRCTHQQALSLGHFSKNHSRPSALASTLFLSFGTPCRSDARGHGLFEAQIPRARPLEVRRAVGLDRSFVRQLWRPLSAGVTRPAANTMIYHLASSLSRGCPSTGIVRPRERAPKQLFQKDNSLLDTHNASAPPSAAMPLIVCLCRCAAGHGAGARSITICSASATIGPTS